jgi:hypothetical protein
MLFFDGALALVAFAVWVFCSVDVITTPEHQARNLPKLVWLLLVIILMDVGSIAWLIAGRPWASGPVGASTPERVRQRPGRRTSPDDDEEFLANLRARAEEQRRRAREAQPRDEEPPPAG